MMIMQQLIQVLLKYVEMVWIMIVGMEMRFVQYLVNFLMLV